jgi:hypothetical protein
LLTDNPNYLSNFFPYYYYYYYHYPPPSRFSDALAYISTLEFFSAEAMVRRYGNQLMNARPEETMALIRALCTSYVPTGGADKGSGEKGHERSGSEHGDALAAAASQQQALQKPARANPEDFVSLFVGHPVALTQFLEAIVAQQPDCSPSLYETLLELLLRDDDEKDARKELSGCDFFFFF